MKEEFGVNKEITKYFYYSLGECLLCFAEGCKILFEEVNNTIESFN
jgi:hypothetical protein